MSDTSPTVTLIKRAATFLQCGSGYRQRHRDAHAVDWRQDASHDTDTNTALTAVVERDGYADLLLKKWTMLQWQGPSRESLIWISSKFHADQDCLCVHHIPICDRRIHQDRLALLYIEAQSGLRCSRPSRVALHVCDPMHAAAHSRSAHARLHGLARAAEHSKSIQRSSTATRTHQRHAAGQF